MASPDRPRPSGAPPLRGRRRPTRPRVRPAPAAGRHRAVRDIVACRTETARRPSRGVSRLRLLPRLLQLLPESALSQVPDPEAGAVGRGPGGPAPAHSLLPDRLHDSRAASPVLPPRARGVPDPPLRGRLRDAHSKSPAPTSRPRSDSPPSCTPGTSNSDSTRTSTASSPPAGSLSTGRGGSPPRGDSSSPSRSSVRSFAESSSPRSSAHSGRARSLATSRRTWPCSGALRRSGTST